MIGTLEHLLSEVLDGETLEKFKNKRAEGGILHPLSDLLKPTEKNTQLHDNMFAAFKTCLQENPAWIKSKASEISSSDSTSSSACIAEISTYGLLLRCFPNVTPVPTNKQRTPDYRVNLGNEEVLIEVHAKQYNNRTVDDLEAFHQKAQNLTVEEPGVYVQSHVVVPFGVPKQGESTSENVISKLAATKQDEGQTDEGRPCILWLDFLDSVWWIVSPPQALPLRYSQESFQVGEFWYAFYGYKGLPIFEGYLVGMIGRQIRMRHYGKFRNGSKFSACIVNTRYGLFLLENPWANNPLPDQFVEKILDVQGFNFACSWLNWPDGRLKHRIQNEYIRLASLEAYGRGKV